jgi:hypothetical protein
MLRSLAVRSVLVSTLALVLAGLAWAGEPLPPEPGDLLGSTGQVGASLIDIDPANGAGTLRAPLGSLGPVTEIEFRADGVLFGTTGQGTSNVITIDPATGAENLVGQHAFGATNGLEFVGDTLYGSFFSAGAPGVGDGGPSPYSLVIVDQTDGSLTTIGPMDEYFPIRGLAYDEATATMYGIGVPLSQPPPPLAGEPEGLSDVLFTIDLTTAATTEVGPTGFFLGSLEFGPDGTLYGGGADGGGGLTEGPPAGASGWSSHEERETVGGSAPLVTIDTATGAGTAVGPTGFPAISGLSFVPPAEQGGPSVLEIPSLSGVGLFVLAALLAAAGLLAVRRG